MKRRCGDADGMTVGTGGRGSVTVVGGRLEAGEDVTMIASWLNETLGRKHALEAGRLQWRWTRSRHGLVARTSHHRGLEPCSRTCRRTRAPPSTNGTPGMR